MFGTLSAKIIAIQFIILLVVAGGSYLLIKGKDATITTLRENNAKLEVAVQTQAATITAQQDASRRQNEEGLRLQQGLADAETQRRALESRIRRLNIDVAARSNRADLESQLNRQLVDMFRSLETTTGGGERATPVTTQSAAPQSAVPTAIATPSSPQPLPRPPVPDPARRQP